MTKLYAVGILSFFMAMNLSCAQEEKAEKEDTRSVEEPAVQPVTEAQPEATGAEDLNLTTLVQEDFATAAWSQKFDLVKNDAAFPSAWTMKNGSIEGSFKGAGANEIRAALAKPALSGNYSVSATMFLGGILANMQAVPSVPALTFNYKSASDHYAMYISATNTIDVVNGVGKKRLSCMIIKRVPGGTYGVATTVTNATTKSPCGYFDSSAVPMKVTVTNGNTVTVENTNYPTLKWTATLKTSCTTGCKAGMLAGGPGIGGTSGYDNFVLTTP